MTEFDKKIKELSNEFQAPESYHKKVDEMLEKIQEDSSAAPRKKPFVKAAIVIAAFCLIVTGFFFSFSTEVAEASFLKTFKQTIMDFFGMGREESQKLGIDSEEQEAVSKPDLMMELQEIVMDARNIYAVIKITAPAALEFEEGMTFDHFGFCEGADYNASKVMPGSGECTLLDISESRKNEAMFVFSIATDRKIREEKEATVFFQDLAGGNGGDKPEVLVEGLWSLSFTTSYTDKKSITVKGTDDMRYSFAGKTADIKKIKLLPRSMTLISDVSEADTAALRTTEARFVIRLKMIDGSEITLDSPQTGDDVLASNRSVEEYEKDGRIYQRYKAHFRKAIDINKVLGIYIADYYVPV